MLIFITLLACGPKQAATSGGSRTQIVLDGAEVSGTWDDGDTFRWSDGGSKRTVQLSGVNALESYGPVHQWGGWSRRALLGIADEATAFARSQAWECTTLSDDMIDCPRLRARMLRQGLAHVYVTGGRPAQDDLTIQANAIVTGAGMWKSGAPDGVVTSVQSRQGSGAQAYDRVCSTTTGRCPKREHNKAYDVCEEVSYDGSSLLYVPADRRDSNKPDCIN